MKNFRLWWYWLLFSSLGVMVFGLIMILLPELTRSFFSLLIYSKEDMIDRFGQQPVAYISLVHGVLGAVMFGWGTTLLLIILGPLKRKSQESWKIILVSLIAWFVPDTVFSIYTGFWQNAVFNSIFLVLFLIPLYFMHSYCKHSNDYSKQIPAIL